MKPWNKFTILKILFEAYQTDNLINANTIHVHLYERNI